MKLPETHREHLRNLGREKAMKQPKGIPHKGEGISIEVERARRSMGSLIAIFGPEEYPKPLVDFPKR